MTNQNDINNANNLQDFLQQLTNKQTEFKDQANTQYKSNFDEQQQNRKSANKIVNKELNDIKLQTQAQFQQNVLVDYSDKKLKLQPSQLDQEKILEDKFDDKKLEEIINNERNYQYDDESSDDKETCDTFQNIDKILNNRKILQEQKAEQRRLRALLICNQQKLNLWAKIKSRRFRKIHNKEQRELRMKQLEERVAKINEAYQIVGVDQGIKVQVQQNEKQEINDIDRLQFIKERKQNKEGVKSVLGTQKQIYTGSNLDQFKFDETGYEDPFGTYQEEQQIKIQKPVKVQQINVADQQMFTQIAQNKRQTYSFEDNTLIDKLKQEQNPFDDNDEQELDGWGSWTGNGAQTKKEKLSFKQKVKRQQRLNQYLDKLNKRRDKNATNVFFNEEVNKDLQDKYNAKGLNITDEEYNKYLQQAVSNNFATASNTRYQTQTEVNVPSTILNQQSKQLASNSKELQKIRKQLEKQKIYIKGEKMQQSQRKQLDDALRKL